MRTQNEILANIEQHKHDVFGFHSDVIMDALDFEHAKPFLTEEATQKVWEEQRYHNGAEIEAAARDYLVFAYSKAADHRGLSAGRSVDKLEAFAWLLGRDDVLAAMDQAEYNGYGVPKLYAFADGMGFPRPTGSVDKLDRMAKSLPCVDDCKEGCV
jgi:hypothetical protein